jgi:hypothetical protein
MCDYSLMGIPNRLAKEGEELVTHRFGTGCIGLAAPLDLHPDPDPTPLESPTFWSRVKEFFDPPAARPVPAVCIPPGASLRLSDISTKLQGELGIGPAEDVTFTQLTAAANTFRDAVRFSNGREILLQRLREGQRVVVLCLGYGDGNDSALPEGLALQMRR